MNNQSAVENMLSTFAQNGSAVAEPQFFGTAVSEYFETPAQSSTPCPAPTQALPIDRSIAEEILAQFSAMGVLQSSQTFFGTPVADYLNRVEASIWDQILEDVAAIQPAVELG